MWGQLAERYGPFQGRRRASTAFLTREEFGTWGIIVTTLIVFLTELTSNTATAAAFLPIVAAIAVGLGENPFLLTVPCAVGASMAYMFPVATPPNAIVYGSGYVTIPQMAKAGLWLNIFFIMLIVMMAYTLMMGTFGIELGVLPEWATKVIKK